MTKSRNDIVQNPDELVQLIDLPDEMVVAISTVAPEREAIKIMAALSKTCSHFYGFFKSELEKQALDKALYYAAYAREKDIAVLLAMLEANPQLLLKAGDVITPGGLDVRGVTIYECLLGAGDLDLAMKVEPFFEKIENGENERKRQYERYRPHIEGMLRQKPDDLMWLFDVIKKSSAEEVAAELARGDKYDKSYQSPLRDALNKFREAKLDSKVRVITKPRMHCNYQNLIHAYNMLDSEWDNLDGKLFLVARQIIGFIELVDLPGYERCLFAGGQVNDAVAGKEIERSFKYKHGSGLFPDFASSLVLAHSGVGFDSYVSIFGFEHAELDRATRPHVEMSRLNFEKLMSRKKLKFAELLIAKPFRCVVC